MTEHTIESIALTSFGIGGLAMLILINYIDGIIASLAVMAAFLSLTIIMAKNKDIDQ